MQNEALSPPRSNDGDRQKQREQRSTYADEIDEWGSASGRCAQQNVFSRQKFHRKVSNDVQVFRRVPLLRDGRRHVSGDVWQSNGVVGESRDGVDAMGWNAFVGVCARGGGERFSRIRLERLEEGSRVFEQHDAFVRVGVRDVRDGEHFSYCCSSSRESELWLSESVAVGWSDRWDRRGDWVVYRRGVCAKRDEKRSESRERLVKP